jgi:hypothetical protein
MNAAPAPPRSSHLFHALPAPATRGERLGRTARLVVAGLGSLGAAASFFGMMRDSGLGAAWIPIVFLGAAALLIHHGALGSQLVARSVWWANLVLGTLLSVAGTHHEQYVGVGMALGTGAALLAMGRLGLDERPGSAFRPVAFRTTLTLGMIMAVADAQALTFLGAVQTEKSVQYREWAESSDALHGVALLASAAVLALAIAGLYRLRVWGLLLAALGSLGVATLAVTGAYGFEGPLCAGLEATSAVQIALAAPIFVAIARRRAPAAAAPSRLVRVAPALVVVALMGISCFVALVVGPVYEA